MTQNRDKKGRFMPTGESNPFNRKWIRRDKAVTSQVDLDAAFLAGFETARRVAKTFSAKGCLQAWRENK